VGSAALSVSFCRPTFLCCFLGVVNFIYEYIPEFLARGTSVESEKHTVDSSASDRVLVRHTQYTENNCHKTVVGTTVLYISQVLNPSLSGFGIF
jgi:hypothetical protein